MSRAVTMADIVDLSDFAVADTDPQVDVSFDGGELPATRNVPMAALPDEAIDRQHRRDLQRFFVG